MDFVMPLDMFYMCENGFPQHSPSGVALVPRKAETGSSNGQ